MLTLLMIPIVYTSLNIRKIKYIAYIYICSNQNLDQKSYKSAKIEAVKNLHAVFLLTAEQCQGPIRLETAMVYSDITDVVWPDVVPMLYYRVFAYTKNVNIF